MARHDFAEDVFSSDYTIRIDSRIAAGHKSTAASPHDAMCRKFALPKEKHDIATARRFPKRLDVQRVAVLNRGQHTSAASTKAKGRTAPDEVACEQPENSGLTPLLSHRISVRFLPQIGPEQIRTRNKELPRVPGSETPKYALSR